MQNIEIIGHLGKDAEIKEFTGNPFLVFSVAVTKKYKDASGNPKKVTTWYYITKFHKDGSTLHEYLKQGCKVFIRGELSSKIYTPDDQSKQPSVSLYVMCKELQILDFKNDDATAPGPEVPAPPADEPPVIDDGSYDDPSTNDDLPF